MSDVASFMARFGQKASDYKFYNGEITLRFDKEAHQYFLLQAGEDPKPLKSVSQVVHIIDKSQALVPWATKMMMQKLFTLVPKTVTKSGKEAVIMEYSDFEKAVHSARTAHKERLEDAGNVGNAVHNWLEAYAKLRLSGSSTEEILSQYPYDPRAENGCTAALSWMQAHNVRWLATEKKIYSRSFQIPGTLDGLAKTDSCDDPACCPVAFKNHTSVIDYKTSNALRLEYILQVATYRYAEHEESGTDYDDAWVIRLDKEDGSFEAWHLDQEGLELGWRAFRSALDLTRDIEALEEYQNARKAARSAIKKVQRAEAKAVRLELECAGHKRYKGIREPRCGCRACCIKYVDKKWLGHVFCLQLTSGGPHETEGLQVAKPDAAEPVLANTADHQHLAADLPGSVGVHGSSKLLGDLLLARDYRVQRT